MKKRILSIILALAMLACMIPLGMVTVSAEPFTETHCNNRILIQFLYGSEYNDNNYLKYDDCYILTKDAFNKWQANDNTIKGLYDACFINATLDDNGVSGGYGHYTGEMIASIGMGEKKGTFNKLPVSDGEYVIPFEGDINWLPNDPGTWGEAENLLNTFVGVLASEEDYLVKEYGLSLCFISNEDDGHFNAYLDFNIDDPTTFPKFTPPHTHKAGTEWMTDGRAHWLACANEDGKCPFIGNDDAETVLNYEIAFSSYEGDALKTALSYNDTTDKHTMLMGRQGRVISGNTVSMTDGRTIIGLTEAQLNSIGNELIIVGCDDSDNNKQITVNVDCAYTWFYNMVNGEAVKINAEDCNCAAFVIIDDAEVGSEITGFGYYRVYNDTVSKDTLIGEALYAAPRTFKAVYDENGGANTLNFYYDTKDHSGDNKTVYENGTEQPIFDDYWQYQSDFIKSVVIAPTVIKYKGLTSTAGMFGYMYRAESFSGAQYLDVSEVTDMSSMFQDFGTYNTALNTVPDVSKWNTGKVTDMNSMFSCYGDSSTALTQAPDVSKWNVSNVTDMTSLFSRYGCASSKLAFTLDLSGWDVSKVTTTSGAFSSTANKGTFNVTIPKQTKDNATPNTTRYWYTTGTTSISSPSTAKLFTLAN